MLLGALEREQDRWFLWVPVLFGTGVALYFARPAEPSLAAAVAPLALVLVVRAMRGHGAVAMLLTGGALAVALGFVAAKLRADLVAAPVLERRIGPVDVWGWIELIEPRAAGGQRLTLMVRDIEHLAPERTPERVRIRLLVPSASLSPGDAVTVKTRLSPPAGPALPGGYDFARTAWFQRLGGVGYAVAAPSGDASAGAPPAGIRARAAIERVRQAIGARITSVLDGETGAIANALVTGQRGGISDATNDAYRDSGLLHVLSISGLHMAIMGGAIFLSIRFVLALAPMLALRFPIKKWAAAAAAAGALGYLLISGGSIPTLRSWIMISIMFLAVMLDRPALALRNVALAALVILFVLPESVMDVSFQMSFAAVVALVSAYELIRDRSRQGDGRRRGMTIAVLLFFGGIVLSTLVASLAVAPFAAYHFHKSQQYAVLANLIAVPLCNLVVMPAALATLMVLPLGLEWAPLALMGLGIEGMTWCAYRVAALPGAVGTVPAIPTPAFALLLAGGLWLSLWRTRWRLLGIAPIALGLAIAPIRQAPDVLVGRDGDLVAVRNGTQGLSALASRSGRFELARWLEHDGDPRPVEAVAEAGGFRCDASGCTATAAGRIVAVARRASALRDDCTRASVVVLTVAGPAPCAASGLVITREQLRALGAHAIYFSGDTARVETAADLRGQRPWTGNATVERRSSRR